MNAAEDFHSERPGKGALWLMLLCAIIAVGAGIAAFMQAESLGWPAFLLLAGLSVSAIMSLFAITVSRPMTRKDSGDTQLGVLVGRAFDRVPTPSMIMQDGKPVYANPAYHALAEQMGARGISESPPTVDRLFGTRVKSASAIIFRLHHTRHPHEQAEEYIEHLGDSGTLRRYRVRVIGLEGGQLWQVEDVTGDRVDHVEALSLAPVGLCAVDPDGRVLAMNKALLRWIGIKDGKVPATLSEFIKNPDYLLDSPKETGRIIRNDTRLITRKGLVAPAVLAGTWCELENGDPYASIAIYGHANKPEDALSRAEQAAQEKAVAETAPKPAKVYEGAAAVSEEGRSSAPFGVMRVSGGLPGGRIEEANVTAMAMCDGAATVGGRWPSIFDADSGALVFLEADYAPDEQPYEAILKGTPPRPVMIYFRQTGDDYYIYMIDASARKELEDQLVQSQKMQAIGQLAGGVAHDFNNLLQAIRLNTDELLGRHPVGDPSYPELQRINSTVTRAAGLVKKLLAFSRKQTLRTETLDITDTLSDMFVLLRQVMVERVKLDMVHGRGLPFVKADKTQIETVMVNLCVNARDALEEKGGGNITVSTHKADAAELMARGVDHPKAQDFVRIDVTDDGTGISEEVQAKIFEPFFTTKEQGKGTGLGLATVYGIVEQSGGHLTLDSTLGKGTTFSVYLPSTTKAPEAEQPVKESKPARAKPSDLAGQGTILFVEDEESVRVIAAKTLRKRGYTVIEAGDGEEALEHIESGDHKFDLMISDVVMPVMDGPTLLRNAKDKLGDARIVFISGYAEEEFSDILSEHPDLTFLPKPFTLTDLAQRVKQELTGEDED